MGNEKDKKEVLGQLHGELGHHGRDSTYEKARLCYYWYSLYCDTDRHIRSCEECQKCRPQQFDKLLNPTFSVIVFAKAGSDIVHMPAVMDRSKYMVGMRDDLSGWVEYKGLRKASLRAVAMFIYEVWMAHFGYPLLIVNDGGPENQPFTMELLDSFNERYILRNMRRVQKRVYLM